MKTFKTIFFLVMFSSFSLFAQESFVRKSVIPVPSYQVGGFGNIVAGVDLDGDGKLEIYAVNDEWGSDPNELVPMIYKYEWNGTSWDSVWAAKIPTQWQNTWPALAVADLDKDGKKEIIWGPANNLSSSAPTNDPARFIVFETPGDGSDNMGVPDGSGGWKPNSTWNADVPAGTEMRAVKWFVADVDGDGADEIVFADRRGHYSVGVASVDNIPDNADGSETWTMEFSGNQVDSNAFVRSGVITSPDGGFGNLVSNVDFDGDGYMDLYAVNNDWSDGSNGELIPTLYKYEFVNGGWTLRWKTTLPGVTTQNTWPVLLAGDWDGDGKGEVIWCPVNNFGGGANPPRIVVYETPGDGSDVMGIDNGDGTYRPNAEWNMNLADNTDMRPISARLTDIDGDGALELVFVERKEHFAWGVVSVSDIPDNGDGSETWTMEAHGTSDNSGSNYRDLAVIGNSFYVFDWNGTVTHIKATGTSYDSVKTQKIGPAWAFKSAHAVDIDGDGNKEIVAADYGSSGSHSVWVLKPDADSLKAYKIADFSSNTYNRITGLGVGDIDGDSLKDFLIGFRYSDEVARIEYQGGDITDPANYTVSTLDKGITGTTGKGQIDIIKMYDIDGDGSDEVFYAGPPRSIDANTLNMVYGDFGNFSITGYKYDVVYANGRIYTFSIGGTLNSMYYDAASSSWKFGATQTGLVNWDFRSAAVYDVDGDGTQEMLVSAYSSSASGDVYLLKMENGAWQSYKIADLGDLGAERLTGGAAGDINGDGYVDYVCGTRSSTPNNSVYRVAYRGGDITDPNNWATSVIDTSINATGGQIDVIKLANMDSDPDLEVVYTGIPRGGSVVPIAVLDLQKIQTTPIADVRVDADGDFVPDNLGQQFTVEGVVTSVNYTKSVGSLSIYIQDNTAGINVFAYHDDTTSVKIGDKIMVTGKLKQYKGVTELAPSNSGTDIVKLGVGTVPPAKVITTDEFLANAEKYEGQRVTIKYVAPMTSTVWADSGKNANIKMWDGYNSFTFRIDKDTGLDTNKVPTYPVNITGIVSQYDSKAPYDGGYQLLGNLYSEITQGVAAPPNPHFEFVQFMHDSVDGKTIYITDVNDSYEAQWHPAVDLNGDQLFYQVAILPNGGKEIDKLSDNNGIDTTLSLTGKDMIGFLGGADSNSFMVTVKTTSGKAGEGIVSSVDTITFSVVNALTGVKDKNLIPKKFFVDQNYPNPFNPTTTIRFGLPKEMPVDLRIYNILGQEVAVLISNQVLKAGVHQKFFNASRLASGTYIYRLQAGNKVVVKKMMLLK